MAVSDSGFTRDFRDVLAAEYAEIVQRRALNGLNGELPSGEAGPPDLFGVALSGGGIRSASFCLGALQALDQYDLIRRIDYLSTVSGGGYTGASMIAAMTAAEMRAGDRPRPLFPFSAGAGADVRDSEQVSHIRDHGNFLAPRGLADLGVSLAIILRGLMVNIVLLLSLLLPLATLIVAANPTEDHLRHSILLDVARYLVPPAHQSGWLWGWTDYLLSDPLIVSKLLAVALGYWLVGWALWRSHAETDNADNNKSRLEFSGAGARNGRRLMLALLIALVVELQPVVISWLVGLFDRKEAYESWFAGLAAALGSVAAATALFREKLAGWIQHALNSPTIGARMQAALAWAGFYALGLALPLLIYGVFLVLTIWGIDFGRRIDPQGPLAAPALFTSSTAYQLLIPSILVMLFIRAVAFLPSRNKGRRTGSPDKDADDGAGKRTRNRRDLWIVAYALAILVFVILSAYAVRPGDAQISNAQWAILCNYVLMSFLVVVLGLCFTENANGLYRLYRDRLRVAFRLDKGKGEALPLHELGKQTPYILLNGTLNVRRPSEEQPEAADSTPLQDRVLRSPDPAKRGRNAEFFLFSKRFVGSASTGYARSEAMHELQKELDLAACVAISGAAVSSSMGRVSVGWLGPTLSLLNVRLGFWLRNPGKFDPHRVRGKRGWLDRMRLYLLAEAAGLMRSDSSRIYVTDGGHIDNIGLYQLLKRRCKYVIVIDAEADPGMNFGALSDVQRFARIDEGVRIQLHWQPVKEAALKRLAERPLDVPKDDEVHSQHFAIGKILYEDAGEGTLLYVKASVTGDEPDYVLDYQRRYPQFPHESTGDQFFSEEQMEAYRSLGFHAMRRALKGTADGQPSAAKPAPSEGEAEKAARVDEFKQKLGARDSIELPRPRSDTPTQPPPAL